MKRTEIEYACRELLPDGWTFEELRLSDEFDEFVAIVRRGRERARGITIPGDVLRERQVSVAFDKISAAIEKALELGRYATTPIVQVSPAWSPYP